MMLIEAKAGGGRWRIFERPKPKEIYVIGVDTASGKAGANESVITVLAVDSGVQCAILAGQIPPEEIASEAEKVGYMYSSEGVPAEIAVEKEFHGATVIDRLRDRNYPCIYFHVDTLTGMGGGAKDYGWAPLKNRQTAIDWLQEDIGYSISPIPAERNKAIWIKDPGTLDQAGFFIRNKKTGKLEAAPGKFDDRISAMYIANFVRRERIRSKKSEVVVEKPRRATYFDDMFADETAEERRVPLVRD